MALLDGGVPRPEGSHGCGASWECTDSILSDSYTAARCYVCLLAHLLHTYTTFMRVLDACFLLTVLTLEEYNRDNAISVTCRIEMPCENVYTCPITAMLECRSLCNGLQRSFDRGQKLLGALSNLPGPIVALRTGRDRLPKSHGLAPRHTENLRIRSKGQ